MSAVLTLLSAVVGTVLATVVAAWWEHRMSESHGQSPYDVRRWERERLEREEEQQRQEEERRLQEMAEKQAARQQMYDARRARLEAKYGRPGNH